METAKFESTDKIISKYENYECSKKEKKIKTIHHFDDDVKYIIRCTIYHVFVIPPLQHLFVCLYICVRVFIFNDRWRGTWKHANVRGTRHSGHLFLWRFTIGKKLFKYTSLVDVVVFVKMAGIDRESHPITWP